VKSRQNLARQALRCARRRDRDHRGRGGD
jgi:hypothetical protein